MKLLDYKANTNDKSKKSNENELKAIPLFEKNECAGQVKRI
jgi:hypothetical protein